MKFYTTLLTLATVSSVLSFNVNLRGGLYFTDSTKDSACYFL